MSYVNPEITMNPSLTYKSGRKHWENALFVLKEMLNILDDAACNGKTLKVKIPKVISLDPLMSLEDIEKLKFEEIKIKTKIVWP